MRESLCPLRAGNRRRPRRRFAGLSLFGVLIGLVVLGLTAVVAIPLYFNQHDVTLDNACRLLARDIQALQNRAALDKAQVRLTFNADGWDAADSSGRPVSGIGEVHPLVRRFNGEGVFAGVLIERIDFAGAQTLRIDPPGLVTEHGSLEISFRGERRQLRILRGSGEIVVHSVDR